MNVDSGSITYGHHQAVRPEIAFRVCLVIAGCLPALLGNMPLSLLLLAIGLAIVVWRKPEEACGVGILYLFACTVLLPSSSRMDIDASPWEMYYWAVGSLIITGSAVARIGVSRTFMVPRSAKAFLLAACAAALYAVVHGVALSDALKQLYGVVLLVVYCGIALQVGDQELLLRRIRTYGVLCALCFFVYYIAVFPKYGFHKEMSAVAESYLLAIILCIAGAERNKNSWILLGGMLLLVPVLTFQRGSILTFLVAMLIALAMKAKSRKRKFLYWSLVVLMALPALWPPAAQAAIDELKKIDFVNKVVPSGVRETDTLYERGLEALAAIDTLREHPWLGDGLGSEFGFESPFQGHFEHEFVDSGWAFLLQKTGLLGAGTFLWFLIIVLRCLSSRYVAISACFLAAATVALFSQPIFFHFTSSPFLGTVAGLLLAQEMRCAANARSMAPVLV
jgi:hypothetical protein